MKMFGVLKQAPRRGLVKATDLASEHVKASPSFTDEGNVPIIQTNPLHHGRYIRLAHLSYLKGTHQELLLCTVRSRFVGESHSLAPLDFAG